MHTLMFLVPEHFHAALRALEDPQLPEELQHYATAAAPDPRSDAIGVLRERYESALEALGSEAVSLLRSWPSATIGGMRLVNVRLRRGLETELKLELPWLSQARRLPCQRESQQAARGQV